MIKAMEHKEAEHNFGKIDVGTINPGKCHADHLGTTGKPHLPTS
jgi:hypothetical protein